jgi:hypothetical protein
MALRRYLPELLSALALSSLSVHLLNHRRAAQDHTARLDARISVLADLATRLRAGEHFDDAQLEQLLKLAAAPPGAVTPTNTSATQSVSWRDVLFGRRATDEERSARDAHDERDIQARTSLRHFHFLFSFLSFLFFSHALTPSETLYSSPGAREGGRV